MGAGAEGLSEGAGSEPPEAPPSAVSTGESAQDFFEVPEPLDPEHESMDVIELLSGLMDSG